MKVPVVALVEESSAWTMKEYDQQQVRGDVDWFPATESQDSQIFEAKSKHNTKK